MLPALPRRAWSFLAFAYSISWSIVGVGYLCGVHRAEGMGYLVVASLCMLGPATAAIIQQRLIDRAPWGGLGLRIVGMRWTYAGVTLLIAAIIFPLALLAAWLGGHLGMAAFGQVEVTQARLMAGVAASLEAAGKQDGGALAGLLNEVHVHGAVLLLVFQVAAMFAACTVNLPMMLGEELGWRGYLYASTATWKPLPRALFTGVVWGLWHVPLILMGHNYPQHPWLGIPLMVVFCILLALLFDWSRVRTGAVWGPCLMHGVINASAGAYMLFAWGGHPLVNSPVGVAGFVAIAVLGILLAGLDKRYRSAGVSPAQ